jgi:hypothetical protein
MGSGEIMETQIYKVRDPSGAIREIKGPAGASDETIIAKAKELFADVAPVDMASKIPGQIPTSKAPPEMTMADVIRGIVETPVAVAANLVSGPITYLSGVAGPEFQRSVAQNIQYQPRTQMAQDVLGGIASAFDVAKIPPFMPQFVGARPSNLATQTREAVTSQAAKAPIVLSDVIGAIKGQEPTPQMVGMGAADTAKALERQTRAQGLRVPVDLTKGQATRAPEIQGFESNIAKTYPESAGKPLIQRQIDTNQNILRNFDAYTIATGAEMSGNLRPVGKIVDAALVKQAKNAMNEVNVAYKNARAAGETKALVPYDGLVTYINEQGPTVKEKLAPILGAVEDQLRKNDPDGIGVVTIDALEDVYQFIGKNAQEGTPNIVQARELKKLINQATEGAGGDLYKEARQKRVQYATQFENAAAVDKLLRNKPGTTDRAVAFEDVFDHAILKGSFDDTRNIALLLKKGGDDGQQAWKELQGQTLEYIKDQATKSIQRDSAGRPVPSAAAMNKAIRDLDSDGKLDYIFGKKGAEEIRELRDVITDVYSPVAGTVNTSNTASALLNSLQYVNKTPLSRVPGVGSALKYAEESVQQKALKKLVDESLKTEKPPRIILNNLLGED